MLFIVCRHANNCPWYVTTTVCFTLFIPTVHFDLAGYSSLMADIQKVKENVLKLIAGSWELHNWNTILMAYIVLVLI